MSYIIVQYCKVFVRSLSILSTYECGKIMSKYSIHNPSSGTAEFKSSLWRHFVDRVF